MVTLDLEVAGALTLTQLHLFRGAPQAWPRLYRGPTLTLTLTLTLSLSMYSTLIKCPIYLTPSMKIIWLVGYDDVKFHSPIPTHNSDTDRNPSFGPDLDTDTKHQLTLSIILSLNMTLIQSIHLNSALTQPWL